MQSCAALGNRLVHTGVVGPFGRAQGPALGEHRTRSGCPASPLPRSCPRPPLQTLDGHSHNISTVCFHPELPLILTGSEDGTVKLWHSTTYRLENTLNYGMERVWAVAYVKGSNSIAVG